MADEVHYHKYRDTDPALIATLKNPDGSVYDLTGQTAMYMHVRLQPSGTVVSRTLELADSGDPTTGRVKYQWVEDDFDDSNVDGYFVAGPTLPLARGTKEHEIEFEVLKGSTIRATFPNDGHDVLRMSEDLGQGA